MVLVFYLTFNVIGAWLQGLLEWGIDKLSVIVDAALTAMNVNAAIHSLVIDGIFTGVGSVLSFLPIIVTLFFFLSLMEDSGYSKVEAGAIQAISTNVAQLLPPVMGGVMFVAVDCMGKNYMQMSRAAIFPSLAYCLILGIVFWLHAKKNCIHSVVPNQQETGQSQPLWQGLLYLIPIAVMVLLMLLGSSAI